MAEETRKEKVRRLRKAAEIDPKDDLPIEGEILLTKINELTGRLKALETSEEQKHKGIRFLAAMRSTTVGGAASEDIYCPGAKPGMHIMAHLTVEGAAPVTVKTASTGIDKVTIDFSADPSADHEVSFLVFF